MPDSIFMPSVDLQIREIQVLQCALLPRQWLLEVDATTKLVRPGSASTPPSDLDVKARRFEPVNPRAEYPFRPNEGTMFEDDVDMVSAIYYSLMYWWHLQSAKLIRMFDTAPSIPIPQNGHYVLGTPGTPVDQERRTSFRTVDA